jgi:hypothetical protein
MLVEGLAAWRPQAGRWGFRDRVAGHQAPMRRMPGRSHEEALARALLMREPPPAEKPSDWNEREIALPSEALTTHQRSKTTRTRPEPGEVANSVGRGSAVFGASSQIASLPPSRR